MVTAILYDLLFLLMLCILFFCGKEISKTGKIFSKGGIIAIVAFTLNEGLRYGRGIDYNVYGRNFDFYENGVVIDKSEFLYGALIKFLIHIDASYQVLIVIQSFLFIFSLLYLLKNYRDIIQYALPLFALLSLAGFENLIRWFLGIPFIIIGLYFLSKGENTKFWLFSVISFFFHYGLLPIPIIFYIVYRIKKILFHPIVVISIYLILGFLFDSGIFLFFTSYLNYLSFIGDFSETAAGYLNNSEYWLTSGYSGLYQSSFDTKKNIFLSFTLISFGYITIKDSKHLNIFAYNLFAIGLILKPIANKVELLARYDFVFYFFNAIVCANIIKDLQFKKIIRRIEIRAFIYFIFIVSFSFSFIEPFRNPNLFLYVWDNDNKSYQEMIMHWREHNTDKSKKSIQRDE